MTWLPDSAIDHLRRIADRPDVVDARYRIVERIGEGGMGTVYLADDTELGRQVALKVLKEQVFDERSARRMLEEARIIAKLEHPGIVPVHDVGKLPDGRNYYVMKLVRGKRLDEYFEPSSPIGDRLRVFGRICETVAFAHAHGVIHRDLKPQNVMVGEFGEVLVLDWGVAKRTHSGAPPSDATAPPASGPPSPEPPPGPDATRTRQTAHGTVIGTPAYMPPEQAHGNIDGVDERSDVFALGAILYFLLTDDAPVSRTVFEQVQKREEVRFKPPRQSNPTVERPLNAICMKAISVEADQRYPGAGELGKDVARFLDDQSVTAYRERPWEWVIRYAAKYRTPVLLVLAYLAMRILLEIFGRR